MATKRFRLFSLKRLAAAFMAALVLTLSLPLFSFCADCSEIRNSVVRLHILANSDSIPDQTVKLIVRNAVLKAARELFNGADIDDTQRIFNECKGKVEQTANRALKENGFDYTCRAYYVYEYFDTREYDSFTLPAGKYRAVKLILGSGSGHNWWCVMFPPLCLPAAQNGSSPDDCFGSYAGEFTQPGRYKLRFKSVELIEKIKLKLQKGD